MRTQRFFRPIWGLCIVRLTTRGLRRGLHSFAASRLGAVRALCCAG
jgi:hypothetical protein